MRQVAGFVQNIVTQLPVYQTTRCNVLEEYTLKILSACVQLKYLQYQYVFKQFNVILFPQFIWDNFYYIAALGLLFWHHLCTKARM